MAACVLVVGVAVMDFVFQVEAMPRTPEKYRARDAAVTGGGCAANAAAAIVRLSGQARLAGRLGDDRVGDWIVDDLVRDGVDCTDLRRFAGKRSSFSSVYVDPVGERQIMGFRDTTLPFDAGWLSDLDVAGVGAVLADTRWSEGAVAAMKMAREAGVPGVLDAEAPLDAAGDAIALASHVAFSAQGLRAYSGRNDLVAGLAAVPAREDQFVCVTDGAAGVSWRSGGRGGHVSAFAIEAVDTLGAGDIWHGALALRLAEGVSVEDSLRFANAVAALKCTRFGGRTTYPSRAEAERMIAEAR